MNIITPSLLFFADNAGVPLDQGYLYFGVANANPETSPTSVFWDAAGLVPASQPIRTINGYPVRNGIAAPVYVNNDYSVTIRDRNNVLISTYTYTAAAGVSSPPQAVGVTTFVALTDTFTFAGRALKPVRVNAAETALETYTPSGGITTFLGLSDTPDLYTGKAGQVLNVNLAETALEFSGTPLGDGSWKLSSDQALTAATPATLAFASANYDQLRRGSFSLFTYQYTAGTAGARVQVTVHAYTAAMSNGETLEIYLEKNSVTRVGYDKEQNEITAGSGPYNVGFTKQVQLAAGDTLRVRVVCTGARTISSALENTWFDIVELG